VPDGDFDAIVIGAGSGGLTVAVGLAGLGRRVALVEASRMGGDCTNTGCIPSKRLIHLSRDPDRDGAAVLADVRATRDGLEARERREMREHPNITLIEGRAEITSPGAVRVEGAPGGRSLSAGQIIVATGSRARRLEIPGLPAERVLTNEHLFELDAPPGHLAILGAGAIGLEMACAFARLGTRITLIDIADRVLPTAIPEASEAVATAMRHRGIDLVLGARATGFRESGRVLLLETPAGPREVAGVDRVLIAIGRVPNVEGLGLDRVGVETGPRGIRVDTWGRTGVRGVWAVGDVTGSLQTHAANALGRRIVQRIAFPWLPPLGRPPLIPSAVFSDPEVAWVGLTPGAIAGRCAPGAVVHLRVDLADTDRGLTDDVRHGFVAIDAVRLTGRILGATAVGPGASELIAHLALAIDRRISLLRLSRQVYAYPTHAGAIGRAADDFARATLGNLPGEAASYARHRFRRPRPGATRP